MRTASARTLRPPALATLVLCLTAALTGAGSSRSVAQSGGGYDLTADLEAGEHVLTVTAPDGLGGVLTERAIIVVGGRPARGEP